MVKAHQSVYRRLFRYQPPSLRDQVPLGGYQEHPLYCSCWLTHLDILMWYYRHCACMSHLCSHKYLLRVKLLGSPSMSTVPYHTSTLLHLPGTICMWWAVTMLTILWSPDMDHSESKLICTEYIYHPWVTIPNLPRVISPYIMMRSTNRWPFRISSWGTSFINI